MKRKKKYFHHNTDTKPKHKKNKINNYLISRKPRFKSKQSKQLDKGFSNICEFFKSFKLFGK